MFSREWKGTRNYCLSDIGKMTDWPLSKEKECPGSKVEARDAVNMTSINGQTVCGVRGGTSYLDATRVNPNTFKCPDETVPCSTNTSPENTICLLPS